MLFLRLRPSLFESRESYPAVSPSEAPLSDPPEREDAYAPPPPNAGGTSPYPLAIAVGPAAAHATEQNARLSTVCVLAFFLNDAAHAAQDSNAFFPIPGDTRVDPADDDATTARDVPSPAEPGK